MNNFFIGVSLTGVQLNLINALNLKGKMVYSYLPILVLLAFALFIPCAMLITSSVFGPKVKTFAKGEPYECGVPAIGEPRKGFSIHFYKIAILFLLFDVESALMIPWAASFKALLPDFGVTFLVVEWVMFMIILVVGYIFAWKKGALEWE